MLWLANGLMVLFWVGLTICYYATRGILHGKNHMTYFIDLIAIPACLISNIILTCFYAVIMQEPFGSNIVFWGCCFIAYILYFVIMSIRRKRKTKKEDAVKKAFEQNIHRWIETFGFLTKEQCNIQVYLANDKPVGKVFINNVNNNQYFELKANENKLSSSVHVYYVLTEKNAK